MHSNRLGSQKASTCSRIKIQCHYHWLLSPTSLSATFRVRFDHTLVQTQSTDLGKLPPDQFHSLRGWTHPSWSCLPFLYSPSFCSSSGPWELSPALQCGSLSLSPSLARLRFYGDMQDIHQCGYGTRPVQGLSPLLSMDLVGEIPLDIWEPLLSQVSCQP